MCVLLWLAGGALPGGHPNHPSDARTHSLQPAQKIGEKMGDVVPEVPAAAAPAPEAVAVNNILDAAK